MPSFHKIAPCLWFDRQAEDAARFYTQIFRNSKILKVSRYTEAGFETHHMPAGTVMTVAFELEGQPFTALNGGPIFNFNEAVSLEIRCKDQQEVDYYWQKLSEGGDPAAQVCGWLKDKFGLSWQVIPTVLPEMITDSDPEKAGRVMTAMLKMKKIDIATLKAAYDGERTESFVRA